MDIYIARQPIFDQQKRLFAYEVLYRSGMDNAFPEGVDSDEATHTVLAHVLFNIGLDTITGSRMALINFTENHLLQRTPTQLPQSRCIIEILESILPTPEVLAVCLELKQQGYTLALDDFDFNPLSEQLEKIAHRRSEHSRRVSVRPEHGDFILCQIRNERFWTHAPR